MAAGSIRYTASINNKTFTQTRTQSSDGANYKDPSLAAAKTGTLTTRTDNNTGTVTMASGHGFATSDKIDLFWSGGARYRMDATVTVNSVVLDGGGGDNLPAATTAVTAMKGQVEDIAIPTASLAGLYAGGAACQAWAVFMESDNTVVLAAQITATKDYVWESGNGVANPLGGDVAKVSLSHGVSTGAKTITAIAQLN